MVEWSVVKRCDVLEVESVDKELEDPQNLLEILLKLDTKMNDVLHNAKALS